MKVVAKDQTQRLPLIAVCKRIHIRDPGGGDKLGKSHQSSRAIRLQQGLQWADPLITSTSNWQSSNLLRPVTVPELVKVAGYKHPTTRIPNSSSPACHKNRHLAISREPRVVEYIRWCQNDRKNMKQFLK